MKKLAFITGSSGFVAKELIPQLLSHHYEVIALVHNQKPAFENTSGLEFLNSPSDLPKALEQKNRTTLDAVIHLAGAGIGDKPWTSKRRQVLESSRWSTIAEIHQVIKEHQITCSHILGASAIGFYGDQGDKTLDEQSSQGEGFAANLCAGVERRLEDASINPSGADNTIWHGLRIGVVLGPNGGMLEKLSLPAKLGFGSVMGDGQQWLSWIDRHDLVRAILFILEQNHGIPSGPVNLTSPYPVRWVNFANELAGIYNRKSRIKIPALCLKPLGELRRLFLDSTRVTPNQLTSSGFVFERAEVASALHAYLR